MPVRVFWAKPGPEADAALRRYWAKAYEIAAEIVSHRTMDHIAAAPLEDANKPKNLRR